MAKYVVPTTYIFSGYFEVKADSMDEAKQIVQNTGGILHIPDDMDNDIFLDWYFGQRPTEVKTGKINIKRK